MSALYITYFSVKLILLLPNGINLENHVEYSIALGSNRHNQLKGSFDSDSTATFLLPDTLSGSSIYVLTNLNLNGFTFLYNEFKVHSDTTLIIDARALQKIHLQLDKSEVIGIEKSEKLELHLYPITYKMHPFVFTAPMYQGNEGEVNHTLYAFPDVYCIQARTTTHPGHAYGLRLQSKSMCYNGVPLPPTIGDKYAFKLKVEQTDNKEDSLVIKMKYRDGTGIMTNREVRQYERKLKRDARRKRKEELVLKKQHN